MIKVMFDTNVIIDAFSQRDYNSHPSVELIRCVAKEKIKGYLCTKQVTDIYYVMRKYLPANKRNEVISVIVELFELLPLLPSDVKYCLKSDMPDFEDSIIDEVAKVNSIQYIVTNNIDDYKNSKLTIMTPKELLTLLEVK